MTHPKDMTMEQVFPITEWVHIKDNPPEICMETLGQRLGRFKCVEEMVYFTLNLNAPLPTLPIGLGRSLGKRAYKSERQKAKARVGGIGKMWVESPIDSVRQRNQGRNSEG